jgi:hypothetical protein
VGWAQGPLPSSTREEHLGIGTHQGEGDSAAPIDLALDTGRVGSPLSSAFCISLALKPSTFVFRKRRASRRRRPWQNCPRGPARKYLRRAGPDCGRQKVRLGEIRGWRPENTPNWPLVAAQRTKPRALLMPVAVRTTLLTAYSAQ